MGAGAPAHRPAAEPGGCRRRDSCGAEVRGQRDQRGHGGSRCPAEEGPRCRSALLPDGSADACMHMAGCMCRLLDRLDGFEKRMHAADGLVLGEEEAAGGIRLGQYGPLNSLSTRINEVMLRVQLS